MKSFANLHQRIAHAYLDMFPPFVPLTGGEVSLESQGQFYCFMDNVYQTLYASPELLSKKIYEDDAFPNRFNRASYGKPTLYPHMDQWIKAIDALLGLLFDMGQHGTVENGQLVLSEAVEVKKKYLPVLPQLGLTLEKNVVTCSRFDGLFPAWRWMAARDHASVIGFSRCQFDPGYPYLEAVYAGLFGSMKAFEQLVLYLKANGYARHVHVRSPYTMDYVKQKNPQDAPIGVPMHGDPYHYGISADYRPEVTIPQYLGLRILEMKAILLQFDRMPDQLKEFVLKYVKKCDDCGYCTQTDKTGKRQQLAITVSYHGEYSVCPLYPGFNFCFTELDEAWVGEVTAFMGFMEQVITSSAP